jgi:transposase
MDEDWLGKLPEDKLRQVSARILQDLKEARGRLNQTPDNSSRPPSSRPPWEKGQPVENGPVADEGGAEAPGAARQSGAGCEPARGGQATVPKKKPGKQPGAKGFGRMQEFAATGEQTHRAGAVCL